MADVLDHIPSFGDLRVDDTQVSAFEAARSELAGTLDIPLEEIELGAVVRLDRGFPMIATRGGALLRAEHAVDFAKGKPGKRGKRSKRAADAEIASSAGVDGMLPSVGDVVAVRVTPGHDMGVILRVLPRRTSFERWRGKNRGERQVLAANVDVIFIVQPLGAERDTLPLMRDRVARSLVLARDCGADPVVVLTKVDRCEPAEVADVCGALRRLTGAGVRVIATSSRTGEGLDEVRSCIPQGSVGMILGESGAGKSTLLNTLLGSEALETNAVRERDDAGRHTTVARIMVALPEPCGVIADCPGLRSLPLVGHERGLARSFPEIVEASRACRFNDCTHLHEPGCAVREGVECGEIEQSRLDAFLSLAREMRVSAQSLDPDIRL
ncbi:ribosome small subunit-dependent GTPase A [Collinsella intestinalis]|uniref:Small ribosomal subunit biogenesis GTPase RsgA n=1 Tax=Collinsella intestinalis TaxID=147207 RepID=A0A414NE43_9ACTN|nr:ribosome small subunit-dependent GTPase A [Collinsella intestinalis]RHF37251.1 ribosome small subunit-dependent GTPase A [Collinsella intestinalis]